MGIYLDDKKLAKQLLAGDELAFDRFFDENFARLYRFAVARNSDDPDAARDITQITLTKAVRKLHTYRGESALFTWLCAICRNETSDWLARHGRRKDYIVLTEDYPEIRAVVDSFRAPAEEGPERQYRRMELMNLEKPRHSEIGLRVFNTSVLTSGRSNGRRWLFSARRGNLDLVIDPKFGRPSYYDVFGEFALELTDDTTLSFNAFYADDRVRVVTESDPEELEQVVSTTRNAQFWMNLETQWTGSLTSNTVVSATSYDNSRVGSTNDPEKMISSVNDERQVEQITLRQDWTWHSSQAHFEQWGLQAAYGDASDPGVRIA